MLLVSPEFLASEYCYGIEMKISLERHAKGEAVVIPIILRPCDWHSAPFAELQALPRDGKAVTLWANRDVAFAQIAQDLRHCDALSRSTTAGVKVLLHDRQIPKARVVDAAMLITLSKTERLLAGAGAIAGIERAGRDSAGR